MSETDLLHRGFGFIELFGFLEAPQTNEDSLTCIPKHLFPSDTILPNYTALISRSLIDGELGRFPDESCSSIDYVMNPEVNSDLTDPDVSHCSVLSEIQKQVSVIVSEAVKFHDEVNRKIRGQFSLEDSVRAESEGVVNESHTPHCEIWDRLLRDASTSGLKELGITDSSSLHTFHFSHLESETQQLIKKRLRNTEPTRQFAIMVSFFCCVSGRSHRYVTICLKVIIEMKFCMVVDGNSLSLG